MARTVASRHPLRSSRITSNRNVSLLSTQARNFSRISRQSAKPPEAEQEDTPKRQQFQVWSSCRINAAFRLVVEPRIYAAAMLQNLKMRIAARGVCTVNDEAGSFDPAWCHNSRQDAPSCRPAAELQTYSAGMVQLKEELGALRWIKNAVPGSI